MRFARVAFVASCLLTACQGATLLRIASGGLGGIDSKGNIWSPDASFNSGAAWVNCGTSTTPVCPPGLDRPPYLNLRYQTSFSYTLQFPPGLYQVTLAFIEPNKTGPGQRVFSVSLNGATALSQFDIYQATGAALIPTVRSFPVVATSGAIQIQFTATVGNAVVSGIQVDDLVMIGPTGAQGPSGAPGPSGAAGPQGSPGPMVPIQIDSYQVICSKQPPQNCSGAFALTRGAIGRILVLKNRLLLLPGEYTIGAPDAAGGISIALVGPIVDNDLITLVYPASGPVSAIGAPQ